MNFKEVQIEKCQDMNKVENRPCWALYIGNIQKTPPDVKYSFCDAKKNYMLIYSDGAPDGEFYPVPDLMMNGDFGKKLTPEERAWLFCTKAKINADFIKKNAQDYAEALNAFADALEEELKKESEKSLAAGEDEKGT